MGGETTKEKPKCKCKKEQSNGKLIKCQCEEGLDNVWNQIRHQGLTAGSENSHGVKAEEIYHAPNVGQHGLSRDTCTDKHPYYTAEVYGAGSDGYVRFGISLLYDYASSSDSYYHYNRRSGSILLWMVKIESKKFAELIRDTDWKYPGKDLGTGRSFLDEKRAQAVRVFPEPKTKK